MSEREEKFEKMLQAIQMEYDDTLTKMEQLKAAAAEAAGARVVRM